MSVHMNDAVHTAAISGSKGSSGLGLFSLSWIVARTLHHMSQQFRCVFESRTGEK